MKSPANVSGSTSDDRIVHEWQLRRPDAGSLVVHYARQAGATRSARPFIVFPGSGQWPAKSSTPIRGLAAFGRRRVQIRRRRDSPVVVRALLRAGARTRSHPANAITSSNRNWQNRMGVGAKAIWRVRRSGGVGPSLHGPAL